MSIVYEYWQHRATGEVWAVKLKDGELIGAAEIGHADVHDALLPYLAYRPNDVRELEQQRDDFTNISGRKAA